EDADDLTAWLHTLEGCPSVQVTTLATCANESHGAEPPTWFYVEADSAAGVARRRCLGCGTVHHILDSEANWTAGIHTSACPTCAQSMFEVAAGLHTASSPQPAAPVVTWLARGGRCVTCGRVDGLTDMFVPNLPIAEVLAAI
ncbi:MAG: hypothetical protein QOG49_1327, partial [Frankiaceae bacterium]|nr:hypothetical protein [Frankiaceae bacterium]